MKNKVVHYCLLFLGLYLIYMVGFYAYPSWSAKTYTEVYLQHLVREEYEDIRSFNGHTDVATHFAALKKEGVYISGFKDVNVKKDDGWIIGDAVITLTAEGTARDYLVFIIYEGNRFNPKIYKLETLEQGSQELLDWLGQDR